MCTTPATILSAILFIVALLAALFVLVYWLVCEWFDGLGGN
jgi:hypothetical protein